MRHCHSVILINYLLSHFLVSCLDIITLQYTMLLSSALLISKCPIKLPTRTLQSVPKRVFSSSDVKTPWKVADNTMK